MSSVVAQLGSGLRLQLGEILVHKGRLSRHELDQAVVEASAAGVRLGEFLVEQGLLYEEDIAQALAEQFDLRFTAIDPPRLDRDLAWLLPRAVAERLVALPLRHAHDSVIVAIADPTDVLTRDELGMALPAKAVLVVGERSAILEGIKRIYSPTPAWVGKDAESAREERERHEPVEQTDVSDAEEEAPAVEAVNALLRGAIEDRASDLHFVPRRNDVLVRARIDGVMQDVTTLDLDLRAAVTSRLKVMAGLDIAERRLPQDGRVTTSLAGSDVDLRVAVLPSTRGEDIVLRIARLGGDGLRTLESLGLDANTGEILRRALHRPSGTIVVAAPTGAGKTTTLYAALGLLTDGTRSIVTIEDPVESSFDGIVQVEVNQRAGLTFERGLRTILRADPDVILVGEIRDRETAEIALQAAMTGHLVLTTVHAESASAALVRLRELGLPETTLGSAIRCILSQRLFRRPCRRCSKSALVDPVTAARAGFAEGVELLRPSGCSACNNTGYSGRVAAFEALAVTSATRRILSATAGEIEAAAQAKGMRLLYANAQQLVKHGVTTIDELLRVCGDSESPSEAAGSL